MKRLTGDISVGNSVVFENDEYEKLVYKSDLLGVDMNDKITDIINDKLFEYELNKAMYGIVSKLGDKEFDNSVIEYELYDGQSLIRRNIYSREFTDGVSKMKVNEVSKKWDTVITVHMHIKIVYNRVVVYDDYLVLASDLIDGIITKSKNNSNTLITYILILWKLTGNDFLSIIDSEEYDEKNNSDKIILIENKLRSTMVMMDSSMQAHIRNVARHIVNRVEGACEIM